MDIKSIYLFLGNNFCERSYDNYCLQLNLHYSVPKFEKLLSLFVFLISYNLKIEFKVFIISSVWFLRNVQVRFDFLGKTKPSPNKSNSKERA